MTSQTTIYQKVMLPASPEVVYAMLTDPEKLSQITGLAVDGQVEPGGCMTVGDRVAVHFLELEPGKFIACELTADGWPEGAPPSRMEIGLMAIGRGTDLRLQHTGLPPELREPVDRAWYDLCWNPLFELLRSRPLY